MPPVRSGYGVARGEGGAYRNYSTWVYLLARRRRRGPTTRRHGSCEATMRTADIASRAASGEHTIGIASTFRASGRRSGQRPLACQHATMYCAREIHFCPSGAWGPSSSRGALSRFLARTFSEGLGLLLCRHHAAASLDVSSVVCKLRYSVGDPHPTA
jgi:hypothetical protein